MKDQTTTGQLSPGHILTARLLNPAPTPARAAHARRHADLAERLLGDPESLDTKRRNYIERQQQAVNDIEAALNDGPAAA